MWWVKYIGIPFEELGRSRSGADCWGLLRLVYAEEKGVLLPSWSAHDGIKDKEIVAQEVKEAHEYFHRVEEPVPFAMAWFRSEITVAHVGIMIDGGRMLHTLKGKDACLEPIAPRIHLLKGFYLPHDQSNRPA